MIITARYGYILTKINNTHNAEDIAADVFVKIYEKLSDGSSVEDDVCNSETLGTLTDALESLDERGRDIIILRFYRQLRQKY